MDTEIKKTKVQLNRKKKQKKSQKFDVLILKRSGTPRSFTINSGKIKVLLFLLCLLVISVPISAYFIYYQYNRIAILSAEVEQLLENIKSSADINPTNEISKKPTVAQSVKSNLESSNITFSPDSASSYKQSIETGTENSAATDNISKHKDFSGASKRIEETSNKTAVQPMFPILPSGNIAEISPPAPQEIAEIEQHQDQAAEANNAQEQPDTSEHAVIIENIDYKLTQNKLNISFNIVNKGRGQKNGHVCMIIYSNKENKASYIVHPERAGINNRGEPLFYKRGIPFSIYSYRHIKTDISIDFTEPFFINFLVYNNNGDITYDRTIDITSQ